MQIKQIALATLLLAASAAQAAVTPEEAKQLGTTLTAVGAEKAANKDGTIPEYTGGLVGGPAVAKGSGMRADPFAADKPRLVINQGNMAAHEDKLTAGTRELLKRYSSYRVDVYPTRRSVALPKSYLDNTARNAVTAKTTDGGVGMEGALSGVPFPIPKTGHEVMWNHLTRYQGQAYTTKFDSWNVDSSGVATLASTGEIFTEFPITDPKRTETVKQNDVFFRTKVYYSAPARRAGESLLAVDAVNPVIQPRKVWQYLPGQRRVKLAPDIAYDTPNPASVGSATYDDTWIFNGALDRFDFKLVGKKEMIVPYNAYKISYHSKPADITGPKHVNPDMVRWELHRVWVVEATLKKDKRHIYSKRVFYIDEDSWSAVAADQYDARGQLYRASFDHLTYSYDAQALQTGNHMIYDFVSGSYNITGMAGPHGGTRYIDPLKASEWTPDSLAGTGVR